MHENLPLVLLLALPFKFCQYPNRLIVLTPIVLPSLAPLLNAAIEQQPMPIPKPLDNIFNFPLEVPRPIPQILQIIKLPLEHHFGLIGFVALQ